MTDHGLPGPDERLQRMRRDLLAHGSRLRDLRIQILRLYATACGAAVVAGALLPAWTERVEDGDPLTYRIATIGWQLLTSPDESGDEGLAFGIGFTGLTVTAILLVMTLLLAVMGLAGRHRARYYRRAVGVLTVIGGAIATLTSFIADAAERTDGGAGPLLLTLGAAAAVALIESPAWQDLWVTDRPS